jgi:glyoxylate reductase
MKKILISEWVPKECLAPYEGRYEFTYPTREKHAFSYDEVYEMVEGYDAYFILDNDGDQKIIDKGKKLKAIANFGVGYNNIDWKYATEVGLPVINTPTTVTEATAEHAVALIISTMRGIARYDREVRKGLWNSPNFSDIDCEVYGRTLGIMGFGRIGKMVCKKAQGLGMQVIYYDKFRASEETEKEYNVTYMSFDEVVKNSDCITLHMPYIPENHHIINGDTFKAMKDSAYLVNAARGAVVDEKALAEALKNKTIKGAGLDVYEDEPNVSPELLVLDNVTLTPHIASCTLKARMGMCREALAGITGVLEGGKPYNVVNPEVLK